MHFLKAYGICPHVCRPPDGVYEMSSRQKRSSKSQPGNKVELQFVNVVPDDQYQNAGTRSLIRAHAAHFHWRHNRPPREGGKPHTKSIRVAPTLPLLCPKPTCRNPDRRAVDGTAHLQILTSCNEHDELIGQDETSLISSHTLTNYQPSSEEIDPFSTYECELPREFVSRCITFNARIILPALFPDADYINTKAMLLQLSLSNPCIMHMFIIGALNNSAGHIGISARSMALVGLRSRAEIVKRMCITMRDPEEAGKDVNIFAIAALAKNGEPEKGYVPLKTPTQGPLRSLQFLNKLALTESVPVHYKALTKLIELKGGLEEIKLPGLSALISFAGLRHAARDLTIPHYSVVTLSCPTHDFIFQHREAGFGTDPDIYRVLSMLNSYTIMIDDFCEGRRVVTASVLIDHRNMAQHALLSLVPRIGHSECYRIAALIYSFLVTFPLPYIAAPFQKLVTKLKMALATWDLGDEMLLWVLAMGGIGAVGLDERQWFASRFRRAVMRLKVGSWDEAKKFINRGLWYEAANERDGYDFWLESQSA